MFMVEENSAQKKRLEKIYKKVKVLYGEVPPQVRFLGNIEADYLEEFLTSVVRISRHPHIDPDLFGFIRLHIAFKEAYPYCKMFNTKFLKAKGYSQEQLDSAVEEILKVPFDAKHQALAAFAIKAIYESSACQKGDFETLYHMGWRQKDVFDLIEHAGSILRNGRILTAYMEKSS